jgi:UDP-perosamine 4-acetyltransferase
MGTGTGLVVFGAGGHGKVVAETALLLGFEVVAFIDDGKAGPGALQLGRPVVAFERLLADSAHWPRLAALAIGNNGARRQSAERLRANGFELATLVHPGATVSPSVRLGVGVVVVGGATLNAEAVVGEGAIVNTNAAVEHDCIVGPFAHVGPGAVMCGGSRLGMSAVLGAGAILPVLGSVADGQLVPPGTVVTKVT